MQEKHQGFSVDYESICYIDLDRDQVVFYQQSDRFSREKNSTLSGIHRIGLGLTIAKDIVEKMGFIVDSAENGKIALEKLEHSEPGDYDLVIMDIQMPVMDGWEAAAAIRRFPDSVLANIPIIALSANTFASDLQKSKESGINVHLSKPMNLTQLLDTIEEITGKHTPPK